MIELHLSLSFIVLITTVICTNKIIKRINTLESRVSSLVNAKREERPEMDLNDRLESLQRMRFSPLHIVKRRGDER